MTRVVTHLGTNDPRTVPTLHNHLLRGCARKNRPKTFGSNTGTPISWKFKKKRKRKLKYLTYLASCVSLLIECDFWVNRVILSDFRIFRCLPVRKNRRLHTTETTVNLTKPNNHPNSALLSVGIIAGVRHDDDCPIRGQLVNSGLVVKLAVPPFVAERLCWIRNIGLRWQKCMISEDKNVTFRRFCEKDA